VSECALFGRERDEYPRGDVGDEERAGEHEAERDEPDDDGVNVEIFGKPSRHSADDSVGPRTIKFFHPVVKFWFVKSFDLSLYRNSFNLLFNSLPPWVVFKYPSRLLASTSSRQAS